MKHVKCICADCGGIFLAFGGVKPECPECKRTEKYHHKEYGYRFYEEGLPVINHCHYHSVWFPVGGACQKCDEDRAFYEKMQQQTSSFVFNRASKDPITTKGSFPGPIKNRKAWGKLWNETDPVAEEFANSMGSRYREIWE
jgi:hypothetical protein